jgi:hypothetical protein
MIAKQTVFLTHDRKRAVPEGHEHARFLLVREGGEINDGDLENYEGADDLVRATAKAAPAAETAGDTKAKKSAKARK